MYDVSERVWLHYSDHRALKLNTFLASACPHDEKLPAVACSDTLLIDAIRRANNYHMRRNKMLSVKPASLLHEMAFSAKKTDMEKGAHKLCALFIRLWSFN